MRSSRGFAMIIAGSPSSMMLPVGHHDEVVGDIPGELHLVGDDDHGHAGIRELAHHREHLDAHLGIECARGLVEQHDARD